MHLIVLHCGWCRHYMFVDPNHEPDKCANKYCTKPKDEEHIIVRDGRTQITVAVSDPVSTAAKALDQAQAGGVAPVL